MNRITLVTAVGLALAASLPASTVQAQNPRSFIGSTGSDANNCSRTAPCRTLAGGYAKTNAGGEINILDAAGYGALTIAKAISIIGNNTSGVLVPQFNSGIIVQAGPTDRVYLRGLISEGAGLGAHGINFQSGKSLTIQNSVIRNLTGTGILFTPNAASNLSVSDTIIADNNYGIYYAPVAAGQFRAMFSRVEIHNSGAAGLYLRSAILGQQIYATAMEAVAAYNNVGYRVESTPDGGNSYLVLTRSLAVNNGTGLYSTYESNASQIFLSDSVVAGNSVAWFTGDNFDGIVSFGGNAFLEHGSPPTLNTIPKE